MTGLTQAFMRPAIPSFFAVRLFSAGIQLDLDKASMALHSGFQARATFGLTSRRSELLGFSELCLACACLPAHDWLRQSVVGVARRRC